MQKIFLLFITFILVVNIFGQKTELNIAFNSGIFSFAGKSVKNSYCNANTYAGDTSCITKNPYGSVARVFYGISISVNRVFKKKIFAGIDLGYETFKSKVEVDEVLVFNGSIFTPYFGKGLSTLTTNIVNLYPHVGYKFNSDGVIFDLSTGLDIGCILSSDEKGTITASDGTKFYPSLNRRTMRTDIRPRIQFSINYKRAGLYIGYAHGLSNYRSGQETPDKCYTRL